MGRFLPLMKDFPVSAFVDFACWEAYVAILGDASL